jgi:hypothetical protein
MAKIKPPLFNNIYDISGFVAWNIIEQTGLMELLDSPRDEQVLILQHRYSWFKPTSWVKPEDSKYTKAWWDALTGDQQTIRWALAFPLRCRKGDKSLVSKASPKVDFYETVSERNALSWYEDIPSHLRKSIEVEISKLPSVSEAKKGDLAYQAAAKVWGLRPELPEARPDGLRGDDDFVIEVWSEWARLYTEQLTISTIVKEAPRVQSERKMLAQALGLVEGDNGFPIQSDGLDDTQAATVRWIQHTGQTPLEFLAETYRNEEVKAGDRINAAKAMLDFVHRKVPSVQKVEQDVNIKEAKLNPEVLKGLSAKELGILETLLTKINKV